MSKKKLQIDQMDTRIKQYTPASKVVIPNIGWIKSIRITLGISLQQLAHKLNITKQSVQQLEQREKEYAITINSLRKVAEALEMKFVYGFVPNDGSLDALIERKARSLATKIVNRTSHNMKLEDQENSKARIKKAIQERTSMLKNEIPKLLWD